MCLFSEAFKSRRMKLGEEALIGNIKGRHTGIITVVLSPPGEAGIRCLCIPNGSIIQLSDIPAEVMDNLGLVSPTAIATFRQEETYYATDWFEFDNGSTQLLNGQLCGAKCIMLAKSMNEYLKTEKRTPFTRELASRPTTKTYAHVMAGAANYASFAGHLAVILSLLQTW